MKKQTVTEIYSTNLSKDQFDFAVMYAALNCFYISDPVDVKKMVNHQPAVAVVSEGLVPGIIVKLRNRYAAAYVSKEDGDVVVFECQEGMEDTERAEFFDIIVQLAAKPVDIESFMLEITLRAQEHARKQLYGVS